MKRRDFLKSPLALPGVAASVILAQPTKIKCVTEFEWRLVYGETFLQNVDARNPNAVTVLNAKPEDFPNTMRSKGKSIA